MTGGAGEDAGFHRRLQDRLTRLRLQVDLGELPTGARFRALLQEGGEFDIADLRVREACRAAGLAYLLD